MPELPEVETVRKDLFKLLPGSKISDIKIRKKKVVKNKTATLHKHAKNKKIKDIIRRGKLLAILFEDQQYALLIHLKMTGQLIYQQDNRLTAGGHGEPKITNEALPNKYTHVIITFDNNAKLYFNDMRQFGYIKLVDKRELARKLNSFGIEPLSQEFTPQYLKSTLKKRKTALKNVLLNQELIAGLGNIYVDEVCFAAGVRPSRPAYKVTLKEAEALQKATKRILKQALKKRGTTFRDYRDGLGGEGNFTKLLQVYGRNQEPCRKCKAPLKRIKIGGRGTIYCANCQK